MTDRLIQQALLQVLQPIVDPIFSEHSYGFRPGRRAQDAVLAAQSYVQSGLRVLVDVDLEKFFDRVNHDILIDRLHKRVMALLRRMYAKLHLTVNQAKSAVGSVFGRKFLGYSLWVDPKGEVKQVGGALAPGCSTVS